jgi:Berberine and berberine like
MTGTLTLRTHDAAVDALRDVLDGEVVTPGEPDWDEARSAWQLAADQHPVAVAYAGSVGKSPDHGAGGAIDAGFALFAVGTASDPETTSLVEARIDALKSALAPWVADRGSFNFSDIPVDGESLYPPETYRGLQWVKAAYDPGELFRASHPIRPAAGPA